mmetsp:Transcript_20734/g.53130  ORF Transcript_20734/g.53130 Transcript_20734/m.53130 type:complete len:239 (+) Transcript_20734:344-1060(+)
MHRRALEPVVARSVRRCGAPLLLASLPAQQLHDDHVSLVAGKPDRSQQHRPQKQDLRVDGARCLHDLDGTVKKRGGAHGARRAGVEHRQCHSELARVQSGVRAELVREGALISGLDLQAIGLVREVLHVDAEVQRGVEGAHDGGDVVGLVGAVAEANKHIDGCTSGKLRLGGRILREDVGCLNSGYARRHVGQRVRSRSGLRGGGLDGLGDARIDIIFLRQRAACEQQDRQCQEGGCT